ncbi:BofC N-terminal domain-containing protein [Bacillus coahuilensis]|uniref:BofC N-terminal domain-containing protein n=1 Tax=Bacillus coahuilensis TaxID=408580 RepID=UPI00018510B2|nr:BofC N-terminal domain-containing protein [Bacillus coahuilensis]
MSVPFRIVWMFLLLIGALFLLFYNEPEATNFDEGSSPAQMVSGPHRVTVILERSFLDGSVTEEIIEEEILSMEDFFSEYAEWTLVDMDDEHVVFMQKVDDISPFIKDHGFFWYHRRRGIKHFQRNPRRIGCNSIVFSN